MCSYYKTQVSPHDPTKLAIHSILRPEDGLISNRGQTFKKTVSFDDIVHFIDEENIVAYVDFDCGIAFYPETPTKIRQIKREQNYNSRSCEKPKFIRGSNQLNCSIDDQHSYNFLLNPCNFWDMVQAAFISLNHTNDTYSVSSQYPQLKFHPSRTDEQTHIRCCLDCERWTVEGRDCATALHSFKEIIYRTDEWTKQLLRLKSWVVSGSPEQWMEFRRLWWTVIVFKCSYLFQLFDFLCLLVIYLLFFENSHFCFFSLMTLSWARSESSLTSFV